MSPIYQCSFFVCQFQPYPVVQEKVVHVPVEKIVHIDRPVPQVILYICID